MSRGTVIYGGRRATARPHGARAFDARTPVAEMVRRRRVWRVGPACFEVVGRDGRTRYRVLAEAGTDLTQRTPPDHVELR